MSLCSFGRGYLARKLAQNLRRDKAARILQKRIRGWVKRVQYQKLRKNILGIQAHARGYLSRLKFYHMQNNAKAIVIQRYARGYLIRKLIREKRTKIIICQAAVRRFLARRQYKKLKIEARSIEHVKKLNKGLENKIISLQQKINEMAKTKNELVTSKNELNELKNKLITFKALEVEIKNLNALLVDKNKLINQLENDIKLEREEKVDLINDQEKYRMETEQQQELWTQETTKLRKELDNINEIVKTNQKGAEENLKTRIAEEKMLILNEQDSDRQAYQKLLQEYHNLEQHCEELERQFYNHNDHHKQHKRNISDISSMDSFGIGTELPEDHGYGSVRSTTSSNAQREKLDNIDWKIEGE